MRPWSVREGEQEPLAGSTGRRGPAHSSPADHLTLWLPVGEASAGTTQEPVFIAGETKNAIKHVGTEGIARANRSSLLAGPWVWDVIL